MKNKVLILMSTFNGKERIRRQIISILEQEGIDVHILIRDDGSDTESIRIIDQIKHCHPNKIQVIKGKNCGWRKSFQLLLHSKFTSGYDYYGFSDQDDIWMKDKVISCINLMKNDKYLGPKLAHCAALTVNENMIPTAEQEKRVAYPPTHKMAVATEYFQGCGMIWNNECMKLIKIYNIKNTLLAHDYWVGLIGYLFGKVYFCEIPKFYHIRYANSQSSDGDISKGRIRRLKKIIRNKNAYMNPACDLLKGYSDLLIPEDKIFLKELKNYKHSFKDKICLIMDSDFSRPSKAATFAMKISLFLNRY